MALASLVDHMEKDIEEENNLRASQDTHDDAFIVSLQIVADEYGH